MLSPSQFGFRKNKSTDEAVNLLVNRVAQTLDNGDPCIGVFLDLKKAFDTVSPTILLRKLECMGIRGTALEWFSSYLSDRRQQMRVGGFSSSIAEISFGVPQGSILGPTLFIAYINDITHLFQSSNSIDVMCYADDTVVVFRADSWSGVLTEVERGMAAVAQWLSSNLLTLNTDKTKYLCFHKTAASCPPPDLKNEVKIHTCIQNSAMEFSSCSCNVIKRNDCIKYLGVTLDEKLSFGRHILNLSTRLRKLIHVMKLLRNGADSGVLILVYKALCQSLIMYCITAWGGAAKTSLLTLERAQRSILKVIFRRPFRFPTTSLYKEAAVLTVRQLYILRVSITYHRIFHSSPDIVDLNSGKRRLKLPSTRVKTAFATRFGFCAFPRLYKVVHKHCNVCNCTLRELIKKVTVWLLSLDYNSTESLLVIPT